MKINIAEAKASDVAALSNLARQTYVEAFGHSMIPSDLAAHLEKNLTPEHIAAMIGEDVFLLAGHAGVIIGFVQFGAAAFVAAELVQATPLTIEPGDMEIRRLYVLAPYQNRGVGSQLMEAALAHPKLITGCNIYLDVWEENERAQRLYRRYGFVRVAEKRFYLESGAATGVDYIMVRRSL